MNRRTRIVFPLAMVALIAALFAIECLNHEFWFMFWANAPKLSLSSGVTHTRSHFWRSPFNDGDLKDAALRHGIGLFLQFILPALLLAAAFLLRRWRNI